MPLIDVTVRPGYSFPELSNRQQQPAATRDFVRTVLGPMLPGLFIEYREALGLDDTMPLEAVQVQFHDFGEDDINIPDIWIKIQFSEEQLDQSTRMIVRSAVRDMLDDLFTEYGVSVPANFAVDLLWASTHGFGSVSGVNFAW